MQKEINNPSNDLEGFRQHSDIKIGDIVAANFSDDNSEPDFYRAKVISIDKLKNDETVFNVSYFHIFEPILC